MYSRNRNASKPEKGFSSSEIIYHLLNKNASDKGKLLRIYTDWTDRRGPDAPSEFLRLLDILKREGLIVY